MGAKLSETNPYLRDPVLRKKLIFLSVASSSAIEGIRKPFKELAEMLGIPYEPRNPKTSPQGRRKRKSN